MKTSNIILLTFSIVVMLITLVFFIDAKNHEKTKSDELFLNSLTVAPFKVVVGEKGSKISVLSDKAFKVGIYGKDKRLQNSDFRIAGDTLYVSCTDKVAVACPSVKTFISNNSDYMILESYKTDSLCLIARGGDMQFAGMGDASEKCAYAQITATQQARVTLQHTAIGRLRADVNEASKLTVSSFVREASVVVNNKSSVAFYGKTPLSVNIKRDTGSIVQVWN